MAVYKKRGGFQPSFEITPAIARGLMRIEAVRQSIETLPITPRMLVERVIAGRRHFPGRERDEEEVVGGRRA